MTSSADMEARLARLVERHLDGEDVVSIEAALTDVPELRALFRDYLELTRQLDGTVIDVGVRSTSPESTVPAVTGFRTVERLGIGGMGEVYKLQDLTLDRLVAGKFVRTDSRVRTAFADFLREARSLALFQDRRIVQIFEFRADADPPVIIMEFVEGFELGRVAPSLEHAQRARLVRDVCDAIHRAHTLGIQHRDLKPSNIMVDASLSPRILDFGLSGGDATSGHLRGTPRYLAPEQLDPTQPIDARTDVYALGVILYEALCGTAPYDGRDTADLIDAIRTGVPRLPAEIDPRVPAALQAIALKAMERRPADRYASAHDMSLDLTRYLEGRPVLARPTQYAATLETRLHPHLAQIDEWRRLNLIFPHEADRLRAAYRSLDAREDDWIATSRSLSYSQIALYLGAFLLIAGGLFYFGAHRIFDAVHGLARPFFVLALPFVGLNVVARQLYATERRAVAVAFFLAGVGVLPLFLLISLHELGWWNVAAGAAGQLFNGAIVSNRQLQLTTLVATTWAGWLAWRTRTTALSTVFTLLAFLLMLAGLADLGLRDWIEEGRFDRLAIALSPLAIAYVGAGVALERARRPWFASPLYVGGACVIVVVLDLLALDGKSFHYLAISMQGFQPMNVTNLVLIDTLAALSLNGLAFYLIAVAIERNGMALMKPAAGLLFVIAPFSTLEPLGYLAETGEYSMRFDWIYLSLAVLATIASHHRQRKSFYYAGVVNCGVALVLIANHRSWFDKPLWAMAVVAVGLAVLVLGFLLDARERIAP